MAVHDHSSPRDGSSSFRRSLRKHTSRLRQKTSRSNSAMSFISTPPPPYTTIDPQDRLLVTHPSPASFSYNLGARFREELQPQYREALQPVSNARPLQRRHVSQPQYREALQTTRSEVTQAAPPGLDLSAPPQNIHLQRRNTTPTQHPGSLQPSQNSTSPTPRRRPYVAHCTRCHKRRNDYEFPAFLPTRNCRHANATCSYCLHEAVEQAVAGGIWDSAKCPQCQEKLSIADMHQSVLRWAWRYTNSA